MGSDVLLLMNATAQTWKLNPKLVHALIIQESDEDQFAYNPEERYRWFWDIRQAAPFRPVTDAEMLSMYPPKDFPAPRNTDPDQEWWAQRASFGLMQIMGAVAREQGFDRPYLLELVSPKMNLRYGCAKLAQLMSWANGNEAQALAAYNGGKGGWQSPQPQQYAAQVIARMNALRSSNAAI